MIARRRRILLFSAGVTIVAAACGTSARGPARRVTQVTAGTPQALGPGIEDAWPNMLYFRITRPANVAVVRVWPDEEPQLAYPVRGATWEVESNGRRQSMPLRFAAGWHRIDLALPLEALTPVGRRVALPDHFLLLLVSHAPIDTLLLRRRLETIRAPTDTGVAYVRQLAESIMADSPLWGAYVVNPCRKPGGLMTCEFIARGVPRPS